MLVFSSVNLLRNITSPSESVTDKRGRLSLLDVGRADRPRSADLSARMGGVKARCMAW